MNEIRTLMEKFWICRDSDKETFYKVKRDIPNFQRFIREQLGWKLIHTEKLLKLEKRPAHAEAFMGISEFTDIRDYCIHVWRMSGGDYERSLSEEVIGNISMKKLETVANPILRETAGEVRKKKKAGYQENILTDLLEDMDRK